MPLPFLVGAAAVAAAAAGLSALGKEAQRKEEEERAERAYRRQQRELRRRLEAEAEAQAEQERLQQERKEQRAYIQKRLKQRVNGDFDSFQDSLALITNIEGEATNRIKLSQSHRHLYNMIENLDDKNRLSQEFRSWYDQTIDPISDSDYDDFLDLLSAFQAAYGVKLTAKEIPEINQINKLNTELDAINAQIERLQSLQG